MAFNYVIPFLKVQKDELIHYRKTMNQERTQRKNLEDQVLGRALEGTLQLDKLTKQYDEQINEIDLALALLVSTLSTQ